MSLLLQATDPSPLSVEQQLGYGGLLLVIGLVQIPVARFVAPRLLGKERQPARSFFWLDLPAVILAFLIAQLTIAAYLHWKHPDMSGLEDLGSVEALALTAAGFVLPCLYVLVAAGMRPNGWEALGVRARTPGYRLSFSTVRYLAGLPMFFGLALLSGALMTWLGEPGAQQDVAVLIRDGLADGPWGILLFAAVIVPLMEEILFRGFLLELVAGTFGTVAGVLVSSGAFAVLHGKEAALPIFGLAIILSLVKLRTRSLGACWFVHGLHNGGTTFLLWLSTLLPVQ
ncbi:CPBP family intramembrane glutamic endopeptidase [Planctomycetes bacterium Poly30]|uniref:CPBP family intramembrane glutamic endopeptidase n=1 Tax=Saltatorellus ferox TaxID=2528018 RepID=UPI0011A46CB5